MHMDKVVAFVALRDAAEADSITRFLHEVGITQITRAATLTALAEAVASGTPDIIILGADFDPGVFNLVRDIRHSKTGLNPFVLISTLVAPDDIEGVRKAMQAGTDDIVVRPVKEDALLQRLRRVTEHRQAFVVTSDYLGPDRRGKARPSSIRRIDVLNTMLEKTAGRDVQREDIKNAVEASMNDVLHARLDSNSYRLGFVCSIIMDAYDNNEITPDVKDKLLVLVDVLRDAAKTAERIKDAELAMLCGTLARQVEDIADHYDEPTERDIKVIKKLTRAVMLVVKPHIAPEQLEKEAREAARNYLKRKREKFESSHEIRRSPDDPPVEAVEEGVIQILSVPKGETVFKQGEPATSAYIVASGSIAVYREIDGEQQPVARLKKGEMFGEMAIIDGTPRRATAVALEDCTLSLISKEMIEEKIGAATPLIAGIMHVFIDNIRMVPEHFNPRARNVADIAVELEAQAAGIARLIGTSTAAQMSAEARVPIARLQSLVGDIAAVLQRAAHSDPRDSARPDTPRAQ